jgi:hypothetical protein
MRTSFLVLCALALMSCSHTPDPRHLACNPVGGVEQVLQAPGVFIGDMHGTEESPAFLMDLSCHVMKSGRPLAIAMEYHADDQSILDEFLKTSDEQVASRVLTSTVHWTKNIDGRASPAMRDALLAIWRYGHSGGKVRLLAYDLNVSTWQERDTASAKYISREKAKSTTDTFWIVFGGNVHARKTKGLRFAGAPPDSENHEPLGFQIRDWKLVHLNVYYRGGTGWGCVGGPDAANCSVMEFGPACTTDCPPHAVIRLGRQGQSDDAYDGVYDVGRLTASPPLFRK